MDSSYSVAQKNGNSKATILALSQPMVTLTLSMPTTQSMALVTVEQPSPIMSLLNVDQNVPTMNKVVNQSQPMVMITFFIRQQIDMGINDMMYQMLKQLAEIVVQSEMHNVHEQEQKQHQMGGHSASSFTAY